jgi:transposase
LISDRQGKPVVVALTEGQRHECPEAVPLLERMAHRMWPEALAADKGYSSADLRNWLAVGDIEGIIPYRRDETGPKQYDRARYHARGIIERNFNRLKRFRRVATRYDKLASSYVAMVTIAMILEWL